METVEGRVELFHVYEASSASRIVVSYCSTCLVEILVSKVLALRGTGRGEEEEDRVGLTLAERDPFNSFFTSSSSVHLVDGDALCSLVLISVSLL